MSGGEDRGSPVRQSLHRGLGGEGLLDERGDLREARRLRRVRHAVDEGVVGDERPREHGRADRLLHGRGLAGQQRLVDRGGTLDHLAVRRDSLSGAGEDDVAGSTRSAAGTSTQPPASRREARSGCRVSSCRTSLRALRAADHLEVPAGQDDGDDHADGVEVRRPSAGDGGPGAVDVGAQRPQRDQGVHRRGARKQRLPRTAQERDAAVEEHGRRECPDRVLERLDLPRGRTGRAQYRG